VSTLCKTIEYYEKINYSYCRNVKAFLAYSNRTESNDLKDICQPTFIAALFTSQKGGNCLSVHRQMGKKNMVYTNHGILSSL
jgi:hypothetical protein